MPANTLKKECTQEQPLLFNDTPRSLRSGIVEIGRLQVAPDSVRAEAAEALAVRLPGNLRGHEFVVTREGLLVHDPDLLGALQISGVSEVRVKVFPPEKLDEVARRSIGELRGRLNYLERCEALLRGQEAYETNYPLTRRGGYDRTGENRGRRQKRNNCVYGESSFSELAASEVSLRQRTIQQDLQIAKALDRGIRDSIRRLPIARKKRELSSLAGFSAEEQTILVSHLLETGVSFDKAISALGLAKLRVAEEETAKALGRLLKIATEQSGWVEFSSSGLVTKTLEGFRGESAVIMSTLKAILKYYSLGTKRAAVGEAPAGRVAA